jgi:hypothetical protein
LTQATFIDRLIHYISDNPLQDRDAIQRRAKLSRAEGPNLRRLIFRNMFIDNQDAEIARIIFNYFQAVSLRWPESWRIKKEGNVLNRTTGFGALMRFLRPAYLKVATPGKAASVSSFRGLLDQLKLVESDFTPDVYRPGSSGESALYKELLGQSGLDE